MIEELIQTIRPPFTIVKKDTADWALYSDEKCIATGKLDVVFNLEQAITKYYRNMNTQQIDRFLE